MRNVVLHYHLFKNAGSTVDAMLRAEFGERWGTLEAADPWGVLSNDEVLSHVLARPELAALSSHTMRLPVPEHPDVTFWPIVFLRHPIDRAGSVYAFERANPDSPSLGAQAAQGGMADYVRWRLTDGNGAVLRNFQTTHLAGRCTDMRTALATHDDLTAARRHLAALAAVGIVERFPESIARFREVLPCSLPDAPVVNAGGRAANFADRLAQMQDELGADLYRRLEDENRHDLALLEHFDR